MIADCFLVFCCASYVRNGSWHLPSTKAWHNCGSLSGSLDCREGAQLVWSNDGDATAWWNIAEEYGGWFLDGFRTTPTKCWLLARAFFLVRFLLRRFPRAVMNALCWLYQIAEPDSKFQRWDAVIVIKGTGQRLVPLDFTNVSIDVYSFSYLEGLMGHHDEFSLSMASLTTCRGFIWDIPLLCWPWLGKTLNSCFCWRLILSPAHRAVNHGFAKAYFEDPRRVDLKARSGQLAKSRIMLVDFEFLYLLGKERDGPRVEEEGALRRPCLKIRFPQSVSHPSTCSAGPLWEPRYRFWGLGG